MERATPTPQLSIRLFGLPQFFLDETAVKVERRKTLALVAYLARAPKEGRSREGLMALLWPDAAQDQASTYLRQAIHDFSKAAGEGWIERQGAAVRLRAGEDVRVDVRAFEDRLARWKSTGQARIAGGDAPQFIPLLEEAAGLYGEDFLAGFSLRDSPDFDDWQVMEAEGLRLQLSEALEALTRLHRLAGASEAAIRSARRWLALDELNENAHRTLMTLYAAAGQRSQALKQFETCQRRLQEALGVAPEAATTQLYQELSRWQASAAAQRPGAALAQPGGSAAQPGGSATQPGGGVARKTPAAETASRFDAPLNAAETAGRRWNEVPQTPAVPAEPANAAETASRQQNEVPQARAVPAEPASADQPAAVPAEAEIRPAPRPSMRAPVPVFLPAQTTPFLGREAELGQIRQMLENPECRLVSLVGPGGCGKTRLAIQAAGQSIGYPHQLNYPHGIYFTGLANAASPAEAIQGIAGALKLELRGDLRQGLSNEVARDQLLDFLAEKKILLVLDNLEQLGEYGFLSDLLASAPGARLLVTSRVRLNLPEEWILEVGGLPFPGESGEQSLPEQQNTLKQPVQQYTAVQLFIKRAGRTGSFAPREEDWPAIARICRMVGGLPLGVELAAAWVKLLTCAEIAEEIARSLDFLESSQPGMPERQRSLRGVFEHSWRLLSENERAVFCRLSIFRGGFTREAAFQVAGASLGLLGAFVDKSMLRRVSSGRYDLHELVKQYAAEKLAADPQGLAATETRHGQYYADWLREKGDALRGRDQLAALAALRGEIQNLRRAWRWLACHREGAALERILPNFILFHEMQGEYDAGHEMMQVLIQAMRTDFPAAPSADPGARGVLALALAAARFFMRGRGNRDKNNALVRESERLVEGLPPSHARAFVRILNSTGPESEAFDILRLLGFCQESVEVFQATGDAWGAGLAYLITGDTYMFGKNDAAQARSAYAAAMDTFDRLENDWGRALCFFGLSAIAWNTGQMEEAARLIQNSVSIYEQMGNIGRVLETRMVAGQLALALGRSGEARAFFAANLAYLNEVGDREHSRPIAEMIAKLDSEK